MGKGIGIKCLTCGHEWDHLSGTGMTGNAIRDNSDTVKALTPSGRTVRVMRCPQCGGVETVITQMILWD